MQDLSRHELFVRLLSSHERQIRRYILTMVPNSADTDDILQDTSAALWAKFDAYDPDQPFVAWAFRFAHFEVLKFREKQRTRHKYFADDVIELLADERVARVTQSNAREDALRICVKKMTEEDQQLLTARYESEITINELADSIGKPAHRLHRALARIRSTLAECITRQLKAEGIE